MKSLRERARELTTLSELMVDREKISTEDIIRNFDGKITISAVDIVEQDEHTRYGVVIFKEQLTVFYCTGKILTGIIDELVNDYGSIDNVNKILREEGGLSIKLTESKTRENKNVTRVSIL
ncbi:MAG: hypothetical protein J5993_06265 [Clostridia bacterium]|nr:hypothetical protein [Clostridia bacterium]